MLLGAGFRTAPELDVEQPVEPVALEDLRGEQILVALAALREALLEMPQPQIHVAAPDLAEIVQAVNSLKPGADAEDVARAVVAQISPVAELPLEPVLVKLVEALERLDFRMQGRGGGTAGVTKVNPDITDRAGRQLGVVTVANPTAATDVSLLAKGSTQTDGTQRTQLTNGTTSVAVEPMGDLHISTGFQTQFIDAWDTSPLDTTDRWTVVGTAPTIANGNMTMASTASTYNAIRTKDLIRPTAGFTLCRNGVAIEAVAGTGRGRFWGLGTPATVPSATSLAQDGVGYEVDQATGALHAVTYAAGVRTIVATLTRPSDGVTHAYAVYFRVTRAYWTIDGVQVATIAFPNIQVVTLPTLIVQQNAAAVTGTPVMVNIQHLTADTSRQSTTLADPLIGTRIARVSARGGIKAVPTIGTYGGAAGTAGTVSVPAGAEVRSYSARPGTIAGSISVPGVTGNIVLPGGTQAPFSDNPDPGTLVGPLSIVFTNTAAYTVTWVV